MSCRYSRELERTEKPSVLGATTVAIAILLWMVFLVILVAASFGVR